MAKSPSAALKKMEDKIQVPGADGPVTSKAGSPPPAPTLFTSGDTIMVPVPRATLARLGKSDEEAVEELKRAVGRYCDEGFATSDPHSVVLSNDQRKEMIKITGYDFRKGDDVVRVMRKLVSISLDFLDVGEIDLPEHLLVRLKSRCHNQDKDPETALAARRQVAKKAIIDGLEIFTGLK